MHFTTFLHQFANHQLQAFFDQVGHHWDTEAQRKLCYLLEQIRLLMPQADVFTMDTGVIGVGVNPLTEKQSPSLALLIEKKPRQYTIEVWLPGSEWRLDIISSQRQEIQHWLQHILEELEPQAYAGQGLRPKDYEPVVRTEAILKDNSIPLNQIFYGPPGTGKTYHTIDAALRILDPLFFAQYQMDRVQLKQRFDALLQQGRIVFVTLHQSFSYEDFVEGIRPQSEDGVLSYPVEAGIFRQLCERARFKAKEQSDFTQALERLKVLCNEAPIIMQTANGKTFEVAYYGQTTFRVRPQNSVKSFAKEQGWPVSIEKIIELYHDQSQSGQVYNRSYALGILDYLKREMGVVDYVPFPKTQPPPWQPYVLILDEINRGNMASIFGELITLIEASKRAGEAEALTVQLPYSKKWFSVPNNVYLIGTMNSADRALVQIDYALRRRFQFIEMPANPQRLSDIEVEGVRLMDLLVVLNQRITRLFGRDYTLGHAFFFPLRADPYLPKLASIMQQQIIPLLAEYCLHDGQKLQALLGEAFIEIVESSDGMAFSGLHYELRVKALLQAASYQALYAN